MRLREIFGKAGDLLQELPAGPGGWCCAGGWVLRGWVLPCEAARAAAAGAEPAAGEKVGLQSASELPQASPRGWVVRSALTRLADLTFACFALPGVATRCQAHNTISTSVQLTLAARLTTVLLSVNTEFEC